MAIACTEVMAILGAVLAGGRSTRFGADKAEVRIDDTPLVERVAAVVAGVVGDVVIIGGPRGQVAEPAPGQGPLQAVIAALREARARGAEGAIVLACDLPRIDRDTIQRLAAPLPEGRVGRVPRVEGRLQVLAARWSLAASTALEAAWEAGERSLTRAIDGLPLAIEDGDPLALADADTVEALERLVGRGVARYAILTSIAGVAAGRDDDLAREEPLEIVVDGSPLAVLLRTPTGQDDDLSLAAGFLWSEGVIEALSDLDALAPCTDPAAPQRDNRVLVSLAPGVRLPDAARRAFTTGASCGVCGKASIESLTRRLPTRAAIPAWPAATLETMDGAVRAAQAGFRSTGALHAAALFDGATLVDLAEDVGRHNAVDKIFGRALRARRAPLAGRALWVSGRVSFELVQKALVAGVDALVAVGAPTSLAVDLARAHGVALCGFVRGARYNVYAGALA